MFSPFLSLRKALHGLVQISKFNASHTFFSELQFELIYHGAFPSTACVRFLFKEFLMHIDKFVLVFVDFFTDKTLCMQNIKSKQTGGK